MNFKKTLTIALIFYSSFIYGQITPTWVDIFGFSAYGAESFWDVAMDDSGNVYVTGVTAAANGKTDIITRKYDWNGNMIWSATYVPPIPNDNDNGWLIELDNNGNVIVYGAKYSAASYDYIIIIKYNNQGVEQWVKTRTTDSDSYDYEETMLVDQSNNIYILHTAPNYPEIIKYNSAGNILWTYHPQSPDVSMAKIELDLLGNLYIAGTTYYSVYGSVRYLSKLDSNGDVIWDHSSIDSVMQHWNYDVAISSDNLHAYVLGTMMDTVSGFKTYMQIHKYDSSGTLLETWTYPNSFIEFSFGNTSKSIRIDENENICFSVDGDDQAFVITGKYDTSGNLLWYDHQNLGLTAMAVYSMKVDNNNNIIIAGVVADSTDGISYVAKYSDSGNLTWSSIFEPCPNCYTYEILRSVETDVFGNIITCGYTHNPNNSTNFDPWALLAYYQVCPPNLINNTSHPTNKICQGDSILFVAATGISYQWYRNNTLISGATQQTYYASKRGSYKCFISQNDSTCSSYSNIQKLSIVCIPIEPAQEKQIFEDEEFLEVYVYPNPSFSPFILEISAENYSLLKIEIYDGTGREINANVRKIDSEKYMLDQLSPGFYFAKIRNGNLVKTIKLIQVD